MTLLKRNMLLIFPSGVSSEGANVLDGGEVSDDDDASNDSDVSDGGVVSDNDDGFDDANASKSIASMKMPTPLNSSE